VTETETLTEKKTRSAGLDLLRVVSMWLVVILHLLGQGGVLENAVPFTAGYRTAWLLETAAYCAVDCYALLTGYLLSASRCRWSSLIGTWFQVFFYSAGITALFAFFYEPVTPGRFLQSCFPVLFSQYWYFTAYFAVYCMAPFLNRMTERLSRRGFRRLTMTLFLLLSLLPTAIGRDPFVTGKGYSFLWLCALYLFGAGLRACPPRRHGSAIWLGGWALCVLTVFGSRLVIEHVQGVGNGGWLLSYPSPLILGAAVCLFQACRNLRCSGRVARGLIGFFAPAAFGVYLIHAQPFVFHRLLSGAAVTLLNAPPPRFAAEVLGAAAAIFVVCALIERARMLLFRLLRLPKLANRLGAWLDAHVSVNEVN
jgi:surface polysaccharide O-acyltransferase-like enzyme